MPTSEAQRPRFYEGQYLGAADLAAVVEYDRFQRARHDLGAHTWGIAAGLQLHEQTAASGQIDVYLLPGYMEDGFGRATVVLAPYKLPAELFKPFVFDPTIDDGTPVGRLVEVWLRYDEVLTQSPRPGFEVCDPDAPFARVQETFRVEVGERQSLADRQDRISVGGYGLYAEDAMQQFDPQTQPTKLYDESVAFQQLPAAGERKRWLVPLGAVRWRPNPIAGQPGSFVKREPADLEFSYSLRRYIGVVAGAVQAADRNIRLRDRTKAYSTVLSDDLVWAEGSLRVEGDARIFGGKLEWRDANGKDHGVPLDIRRANDPTPSNTMLQVAIGEAVGGHNRFSVGPLKAGATPKVVDEKFAVLDNGNVGIGTVSPSAGLEIDRGTTNDLALQLSSTGPGWGSGMEFRNTRTYGIYSGGGTLHLADVDNNVDRLVIDTSGNVGIGTSMPLAKLHAVAAGGFAAAEGANGVSLSGNVPILGQADSTVFGILNKDGREAFAINIDNNGGTNAARGVPTFYDKYDGQWHDAISLKNGNVGIGTTAPLNSLHVARPSHLNVILDRTDTPEHLSLVVGSAGSGLRFSQSNDFFIASQPYSNRNDGTFGTEHLRITSAGNVGIGTASPSARLSVVAAGASELTGTAKSATLVTSAGRLGTAANGELPLASIGFLGDNSVSLGIRALRVAAGSDWRSTAIGLGMDVDDTVRASSILASSASLWFKANGYVDIGTTTMDANLQVYGLGYAKLGWSGPSDETLKQNVQPLTGTLGKMLQLRGVSFEWKEPEKFGNLTGPQIGMIAQEVESIFPQWVRQDPQGLKAVSFMGFEALTVEAFREMKLEMDTVRSRLAELERLVKAPKKRPQRKTKK